MILEVWVSSTSNDSYQMLWIGLHCRMLTSCFIVNSLMSCYESDLAREFLIE